jgi:hypothetical protein
MVVKIDLDFEKLMKYERSGSSSASSFIEMESPRQGIEADMYLMELTSPGLETPQSSPRKLMRDDESLINEKELNNSSVETLVRELPSNMADVVSKRLLDAYGKDCLEVEIHSGDKGKELNCHQSELETALAREIAEGVFAV